MLSMKVLESSSQAVSYYEKDDYYTRGQEELRAAGEWFGKGLALLDRGIDPGLRNIPGIEIRAAGLRACPTASNWAAPSPASACIRPAGT